MLSHLTFNRSLDQREISRLEWFTEEMESIAAISLIQNIKHSCTRAHSTFTTRPVLDPNGSHTLSYRIRLSTFFLLFLELDYTDSFVSMMHNTVFSGAPSGPVACYFLLSLKLFTLSSAPASHFRALRIWPLSIVEGTWSTGKDAGAQWKNNFIVSFCDINRAVGDSTLLWWCVGNEPPAMHCTDLGPANHAIVCICAVEWIHNMENKLK